jgi:hypothetical protein
VSTVSAPSLLGSLVDLDVLDDQVAGVESLGVGVGLSVLEETDKDLSGLDGPASLGDTESLACSSQRVFLQSPIERHSISRSLLFHASSCSNYAKIGFEDYSP